jgi:hypothetical protein
MTAVVTDRWFNQDTARAQRAAKDGPVFVTNRGRPSHVLRSFEDSSAGRDAPRGGRSRAAPC